MPGWVVVAKLPVYKIKHQLAGWKSSYDGSFTGRTAHYHIVLACSATTVQCSGDKDDCHRAAHL